MKEVILDQYDRRVIRKSWLAYEGQKVGEFISMAGLTSVVPGHFRPSALSFGLR